MNRWCVVCTRDCSVLFYSITILFY